MYKNTENQNPLNKMKNIILFLLSMIHVLASNVNTTAPIDELNHYGADFTDTDGDGMTDVAELRYGFDPNDKNSHGRRTDQALRRAPAHPRT